MTHIRVWMLLVLLALPATAQAELKVVASLPTLGAIAQEVGGEHIELTVLAAPTEDPHYVDPRPDYVLKLNAADMLIINGLELEIGWIPSLQTAARNSACTQGGEGFVDASTLVRDVLLGVPTGKVSREQGDIHAGGNPHFLMDPRAVARIAAGLAERMAELDPENEDAYMENADRFVGELERFSREQAERFAALPEEKRRVVSYHASLIYLYDWLALERVATVEPKPGIAPDPGHVATVLKTMKSKKARVVVQESHYPTSTSKKLTEITGGTLVVIQSGVDVEAGERFIPYMEKAADALFTALQ